MYVKPELYSSVEACHDALEVYRIHIFYMNTITSKFRTFTLQVGRKGTLLRVVFVLPALTEKLSLP